MWYIPVVRGGALFPECWVRLALQLQYPKRCRVSYSSTRKKVGLTQHNMILMTPCANMAMDIITNPHCSRTTDLDMAFSSSLGSDVSVALVSIQVKKIIMILAATWSLDTEMVSGG